MTDKNKGRLQGIFGGVLLSFALCFLLSEIKYDGVVIKRPLNEILHDYVP